MGRRKAESKSKIDYDGNILGKNEIQDVQWLCSLSESELEFLIGLKMMVIRRAKQMGHESLAKHFNLKTLRGLSCKMMQHFKEQLKDSLVRPGCPDSFLILDKCKLLQLEVEESFSKMSSEELWPYICPDKKKGKANELDENKATPKRKKQKTGAERFS